MHSTAALHTSFVVADEDARVLRIPVSDDKELMKLQQDVILWYFDLAEWANTEMSEYTCYNVELLVTPLCYNIQQVLIGSGHISSGTID